MEPAARPVCTGITERRLLVAYDAVLNSHQLPEMRHTVGVRVDDVCPEVALDCQLALQELCLAVLARFGVCAGLRVYDCGGGIRIEVDGPVRTDGTLHSAHGIVEALATACGVAAETGVRTGVDPRAGVSTAWCELFPPQASAA